MNGYQVNTVYLAQTGQPVTIQSGRDSNANGDSAGDRAMLNPFATSGTIGSSISNVCGAPNGSTYVAGACHTGDPTVGYVAKNPAARFVVTGAGVVSNLGRNSWTTPGFGVWNLGVGKKTYFGEQRYLMVRADVFNVLNHPSFALSNGNVFSNAGVTVGTTTPGYVLPADPNFLNAPGLFSGGFRSITLGLKFVF
jgi:hypothetical protein